MSLMLEAIRRIETSQARAGTTPSAFAEVPATPARREAFESAREHVKHLDAACADLEGLEDRLAAEWSHAMPATHIGVPLPSAQTADVRRPLLTVEDILPGGLQSVAYRALVDALAARIGGTHATALALVSVDGTTSCTAVALRLAALWGAQSMAETLLVEAGRELPWPGLLPVLEGNWGLTDVLQGHASLEDVIRPTLLRHVSQLPGGLAPWHESAFARLPGVWNELKLRYRLIMVDAGAIGETAATALAASCDGACLAVLLGRARRQSTEAAVDRLVESQAPFWGCVLLDPS